LPNVTQCLLLLLLLLFALQYWFPLEDVLKWMGEEATAEAGAQFTPISPAAADTNSTPRRRTRQATAAAAGTAGSSGKRQQRVEAEEEQECDVDSGATADEVFDMPLWQQEQQPQQLSRRQRVRRRLQQGFDETRSEAVVAAGVLLAVLVMAAAVWLARWPAHDLESSLDALRSLSSDVREKLRARSLV
jgi:hypothetical protein